MRTFSSQFRAHEEMPIETVQEIIQDFELVFSG